MTSIISDLCGYKHALLIVTLLFVLLIVIVFDVVLPNASVPFMKAKRFSNNLNVLQSCLKVLEFF